MRIRNTALAGMLFAAVAAMPVGPAHAAMTVGGCPSQGGFEPAQFGDIPAISAEAFAHFDVNADGVICAKFLKLPDQAVEWLQGVAIDNTVGRGQG